MEYLSLNPHSYLTASKRKSLSSLARYLLKNELLSGEVLDFGCGFGNDVELLKGRSVNIVGYDKHYFSNYPVHKFDTIICSNVLEVLMPEEQESVIIEVSNLLKPTGRGFFSVSRNIHKEGFRIHKINKKPIYKADVKLNFKSVFKNEKIEIYEYKHFNQTFKKGNTDCPFCNPDPSRELIAESRQVYSMYDGFPVSKGHALIIPKKHIANYFELTFNEQSACIFILNAVKKILNKKFNPDGFNVGININQAAGQTVPHVHIHLIPRYKGDVKEPRGGVRGVIPKNKNY
jgi:diadenosine tetraphosphate (Ap4A) HIT family hydrolase